jgi:DNA-binding winged helix-turn-helix (wHTH) protein
VRFVVGSLRAALRAAGAGELVENVRGAGYRLASAPERVRIAS